MRPDFFSLIVTNISFDFLSLSKHDRNTCMHVLLFPSSAYILQLINAASLENIFLRSHCMYYLISALRNINNCPFPLSHLLALLDVMKHMYPLRINRLCRRVCFDRSKGRVHPLDRQMKRILGRRKPLFLDRCISSTFIGGCASFHGRQAATHAATPARLPHVGEKGFTPAGRALPHSIQGHVSEGHPYLVCCAC